MEILTGRIYFVEHEIKGAFYMEVQSSDEVFTVGRIIRRKTDKIQDSCMVCGSDLIKIRNSLSWFTLHDSSLELEAAERT